MATGGEEPDRSALGFGGLNGNRFCPEVWNPDRDKVRSKIWGPDVSLAQHF